MISFHFISRKKIEFDFGLNCTEVHHKSHMLTLFHSTKAILKSFTFFFSEQQTTQHNNK